MRRRGFATAAWACALVAGQLAVAEGLTLPPGTSRAEETIDAGALLAPVRFLADDLLEGRAPASRGDRLARLYIRTALESLGLEPAADDGGLSLAGRSVLLTGEQFVIGDIPLFI